MNYDHHTYREFPAPAVLRVASAPGVSQEAGGSMPLFRSWQDAETSPRNSPNPVSPQSQRAVMQEQYTSGARRRIALGGRPVPLFSRCPQASRRTPRGLALIGGTMSLGVFLSGCATWEAIGAFFTGAGKAVTEAGPEIAEDALSGNWLSAAVGLAVTAVVGGVLELKRRRRKRLRDEAIGNPPA